MHEPPSTASPIPPFDPFDPALREDPYRVYARYRRHDPIHRGRSPLPGYPETWYLFRHRDVLAVLRDPRFLQQRPGATGALGHPEHACFLDVASRWMLLRDPPEHARLRASVSRAFSPARIAGLRATVEVLADDLLDRVQGRGETDLMQAFAWPLPLAVISHLLGITIADRDRFRAQSRSIADAFDVRTSLAPLVPAARALGEWIDELRGHVATRRERPGTDLLSTLVAARDTDGALDEDELMAMLTLLLFAAQETTSDLIGTGVLALLRHPDQLRLLERNPALITGAVDEMLRFDPPTQAAVTRTAAQDCMLGDKRVAAGDPVMAMLGSAARDPDVFTAPDRFDITRNAGRTNVVFGHGAHFCLGAHLARLETEVAVARLFSRLPGLRLASDPVSWRANFGFRGLTALPVQF